MPPSEDSRPDVPTPTGPDAPGRSPDNTLWDRRHHAPGAGLLLLCLFLFGWRLGAARLFDLDEALYVTGARNMAASGDWVTPRLNSRPIDDPAARFVPFFEKPALVYWLPALSLRLFGTSEGAARLPALLAALLTVGATVWAGARWFGPRAGLLAGLTLAACPLSLLNARQMTTDGLLALWLTLALLAFRETDASVREGRPAGLRGPLLFWTACALAVLTKGAVGLLLPVLVIGAYLVTERFAVRLRARSPRNWLIRVRHRPAMAWRPRLLALRPLPGLLLLLLLAAPWHAAVWRAGGRDAQGRTWTQEYLGRQHVGRFRGGDTVHNAPLPSYVAYFLLGFFPWACFAPAAFRTRTTQTRRHGEKQGEAGTPDAKGEENSPAAPPRLRDTDESAARFLRVWFWAIFGFFSLGAAKLPTYIAPAYPAAALLVGRWLDEALRETASATSLRSLRRGAFAALVTAGLLLLAAFAGPRFAPPASPVPPDAARLALLLTLTLFAGAASALFAFRLGKRGVGVGALTVAVAALAGVGVSEGYAVANRAVLAPYQDLAALARPYAERGVPVVYYAVIPRRPSMLFYAGYSPLERKESPLLPFLRRHARGEAVVVTSQRAYRENLLPELTAAPGFKAETLSENEGWRLLRLAW